MRNKAKFAKVYHYKFRLVTSNIPILYPTMNVTPIINIDTITHKVNSILAEPKRRRYKPIRN